ncbi:MAG: ubiquinone/menaquinone biosynthesis methyltransferase [Candidatus Marinimicrobia bacterium]|nr:ubiquinone/menaquinone biosynthesis methyltransferase [Candidatus Neomarinimicrobiota bacterium]
MAQFVHGGRDKRRFIRHMFEEIVPRYDFLNRLLSGGRDMTWRKRLAAVVDLQPAERLLDLACGTGDVALQVGRRQPGAQIVGADPIPRMLDRALIKLPTLQPVCCESEALPFPDGVFQAVTIAFGVRNFSDLQEGLEEVYRVLARGGRLGILEFAMPEKGLLSPFYRWYLTKLLPRLGAMFSRGYAYQYLPESIAHFPAPGDFSDLLASIGFDHVNTEPFLNGAVWIYCAYKA